MSDLPISNFVFMEYINRGLNRGFKITEIEFTMQLEFGLSPREAAKVKRQWYKYGKRIIQPKWR